MDSNSTEKSFSQQPLFFSLKNVPFYLGSLRDKYIDFHKPPVFMGCLGREEASGNF